MPTTKPGFRNPAPNSSAAASAASRKQKPWPANAWTGLESLEPRTMLSAGPAAMDAPAASPVVASATLKTIPLTSNQTKVNAPATVTAAITTPVLGVLNDGPPKGVQPFGASSTDTSEYMLGDVLVNVVLMESNGAIDASTENWTPAMIANVKTQITQGLIWWRDTFYKTQTPASGEYLNFYTNFTYADKPIFTSYEPINRPSTSESLWIDNFLTTAGAQTAAGYMTDMRNYDNQQRLNYGTDWSFTIFVVNSLADANGAFSDGASSYAYVNGPFLVETYDNGAWGIDRMKMITAHETGHIFGALDEYAGGNTYTTYSGYYKTQNLNAADGNPNPATRVTSLMSDGNSMQTAFNTYTTSPSEMQMIGWKDTDKDGISDVLDVPLSLTGSGSYNAANRQFVFSGSSTVGTLANLNPNTNRHAITLNTLDALQYKIDNGAWATLRTLDGYTATLSNTISLTTLAAGSHTISFRTIDNALGLTSNTISSSFTISGSNLVVVGIPVAAFVTQGSPTKLVKPTLPKATVAVAATIKASAPAATWTEAVNASTWKVVNGDDNQDSPVPSVNPPTSVVDKLLSQDGKLHLTAIS